MTKTAAQTLSEQRLLRASSKKYDKSSSFLLSWCKKRKLPRTNVNDPYTCYAANTANIYVSHITRVGNGAIGILRGCSLCINPKCVFEETINAIPCQRRVGSNQYAKIGKMVLLPRYNKKATTAAFVVVRLTNKKLGLVESLSSFAQQEEESNG